MIDEELYQQATDELNSNRRRPHLWARACALASDDHDEARYLYTNLRVEEMIADREAVSKRAPERSTTEDHQNLKLQPIDFSASVADDNAPAPISSGRAGKDTPGTASMGDREIAEFLDSSPLRPSSEHRRTRLDLDTHNELDLDPDELARENIASSDTVSPIDGRRLGRDGAPPDEQDLFDATDEHDRTDPGGRPNADAAPDDLEWLDSGVDESLPVFIDAGPKPMLPPEVATSGLSDEQIGNLVAHARGSASFERTDRAEKSAGTSAEASADDGAAPFGTDASPSNDAGSDLSDADFSDADAIADDSTTADSGAAGSIEVGAGPSAPAYRGGAAIREDYADSGDLEELLDPDERDDPLEIDGPGRLWAVYENAAGRLVAIKRGVCWPALFVTLPWLVLRGLFGTAIIYTLLWIACIGGLLLTGLELLDAGADATSIQKLVCGGFAALSVIGLLIVPFARANRWREYRQIRHGGELLADVRARNGKRAIARLGQQATEHTRGRL